jgi:hypothetical protein
VFFYLRRLIGRLREMLAVSDSRLLLRQLLAALLMGNTAFWGGLALDLLDLGWDDWSIVGIFGRRVLCAYLGNFGPSGECGFGCNNLASH